MRGPVAGPDRDIELCDVNLQHAHAAVRRKVELHAELVDVLEAGAESDERSGTRAPIAVIPYKTSTNEGVAVDLLSSNSHDEHGGVPLAEPNEVRLAFKLVRDEIGIVLLHTLCGIVVLDRLPVNHHVVAVKHVEYGC